MHLRAAIAGGTGESKHHGGRYSSSFLVPEYYFHDGILLVSANVGTTHGQHGG